MEVLCGGTMKSRFKIKMIFILTLLFMVFGFTNIAMADSLPANLTLNQIQRVDFGRADTSYLALFPDLEADQLKINNLLNMYNQAVINLSSEELIDFGDSMTFFMNSVDISLEDGQIIAMYLYNDGVYFISGYQNDGLHGYRITGGALSKKLYDLALSYFLTAQGVILNSREIRLGEEVKISSDCAWDEAKIFLMPTYSPCTIPSAPSPYPIPEAILIAQIPVEHDRFTYTFTLTEEMGKKIDSSAGKIKEGEWQLVVISGGMSTFSSVNILPREIPEPLAVAYDRGRVYIWNEKGIVGDYEINAQDQPLLINNSKFNEQTMTYLSLEFLQKYLGVQVKCIGTGKYILGSELSLNLETNRINAKMNGTMPYLSGYLGNFSGRLRLPWEGIAKYFSYKTIWWGPEQVVFLRNLDDIPAEIQGKMGQNQQSRGTGQQVKIMINGKSVNYTTLKPYLDPISKKVMVPLRDTVKALGGNLTWYPLHHSEYPDEDTYYYRWAGANTGIVSYTQVRLGNRVWDLYQKAVTKNTVTMVSLKQLALSLGYNLTWDSKNKQVIMSLY